MKEDKTSWVNVFQWFCGHILNMVKLVLEISALACWRSWSKCFLRSNTSGVPSAPLAISFASATRKNEWMRNLLSSFDEFKGKEQFPERDLQDYLGRHQDLWDEWMRRAKGEIELIRQIEINIDYILMLVKKYRDFHCADKEILITIQKAVDASPELRSKKQRIETFISGINDVEDVLKEWHGFAAGEREKELTQIIRDEKLRESENRKFLENAFRDGEIKTTGTDIDKLCRQCPVLAEAVPDPKKTDRSRQVDGIFRSFRWD